MTSPSEYAARGWQIFPCHGISRGRCTCSKGINCSNPGKHPLTHNGVKDATGDPNTIRAWQARWPFANWAVACGRSSGILVIDIDPRKGGYDSIDQFEQSRPDGPLPDTLSSTTGGAGKHLFYTFPQGVAIKNDNRGGWLAGVDIKTDGGYVILPEALHISGGSYSWNNWLAQPAPLPQDVVSSIASSTAGGSPKADLPSLSDLLSGVAEGQRDETLFREACRMRRQLGDDSRRAVEIVILEAARNCVPPFPEEDAKRKVEQAWAQDHSDSFVDWQMGELSIRPQTDLGNAHRFIDAYGADVSYVDGWGWMIWAEVGWSRDFAGRVPEMTHTLGDLILEEAREMEALPDADTKVVAKHVAWAFRSQSADKMDSALRVAKNVSVVRKSADDFDADDYQYACRNGMLDLRTGQTRAVDRDDLVTKNSGVVYDPDFVLPEWDKFILEACDGDQEMVTYLQHAAGYSLTGSNKEEALFMISGPPASGKSTFLDGMLAAMGGYSTTTQSDTFMWKPGQQPPSLELARMAGIRLVSMSEIKEGASFNEDLIKGITGGDPVTGKFLYENPFTYRPKFKIWIGTNHDPAARDDALWRRIKKVIFPNVIPFHRRDPKLKIMLRDPDVGGKAVLAWAVRGCIDWHQSGLQQPASVSRAVMDYRMDQDYVTQFISECMQRADGERVPLIGAYGAYRSWCQSSGLRPRARNPFANMMKERGVKTTIDDSGDEMCIDYRIRATASTWSWS